MEMKLKEQLNGIQHVGIPTNDIEKTIRFYETLGFEVAFQTVNEGAAKMEDGAIDHIAIDVKDIEKVYEMISEAGLNTTKDTVHFLPFWENGVKFFTIEGPNKEKVEFSQYL